MKYIPNIYCPMYYCLYLSAFLVSSLTFPFIRSVECKTMLIVSKPCIVFCRITASHLDKVCQKSTFSFFPNWKDGLSALVHCVTAISCNTNFCITFAEKENYGHQILLIPVETLICQNLYVPFLQHQFVEEKESINSL